MSDEGKQCRSRETFWAIPRGTVVCTPQPSVKLTPAEYHRRIEAEALALSAATLQPVPLQPAKRPHE